MSSMIVVDKFSPEENYYGLKSELTGHFTFEKQESALVRQSSLPGECGLLFFCRWQAYIAKYP